MDWVAPPEGITWTLPKPITFGQTTYPTVTLRSPTAGDILKATAITGASPFDISLRLISAVSVEAVPYEALLSLPAYMVEQMSAYLDTFGGAPLPGPLEAWRASRLAAAAEPARPSAA